MEKNHSAFSPAQNFVRILYIMLIVALLLLSPVFSEVIPSQGYFRAILLLPWGGTWRDCRRAQFEKENSDLNNTSTSTYWVYKFAKGKSFGFCVVVNASLTKLTWPWTIVLYENTVASTIISLHYGVKPKLNEYNLHVCMDLGTGEYHNWVWKGHPQLSVVHKQGWSEVHHFVRDMIVWRI